VIVTLDLDIDIYRKSKTTAALASSPANGKGFGLNASDSSLEQLKTIFTKPFGCGLAKDEK
jgi:hypothetical protein